MSSGEAEFYGAVRGASAGLGMRALYSDIGYALPLRLWTDSSAAIGIASRQGLGKLRHVECTSLWLQQRLRHKDLEIRKIAGESNPADLYTKFIESKVKIEQLLNLFGAEFRDGRPEAAPGLRRGIVEAGICNSDDFEFVGGKEALLHDTSILPHLMTAEDIEQHFPSAEVKPLADGEADVRPEEELRDPGPRGHLRLAPAFFRPNSDEYSPARVYIVESEENDEEDTQPQRIAARRRKPRARRAARTSSGERSASAVRGTTRLRGASAGTTRFERTANSSGRNANLSTDARLDAVRGGGA